MNIKPGGLSSYWYGQTEENIREAFRVAREAGEQEPDVPVVMFFDEVDSIAAARGQSHMRVDDRVTAAFLAELNGFESQGNIVVIAATNRRDTLDAAAIRQGRLGDLVLEVPRPRRDAASAILDKHLHPDLPYGESPSGATGGDARQEVLEAVVSRAYAPNGLGVLARITFRDGKGREVEGRDLMSGALLANVTRVATLKAGLREARTGEEGIRQDDLLEALEAELEKTVRTLTPRNCHRFIDDLPQDVDVVRVEPVQRRVRMETRYLTVA
jgi:proteasome-associated ATPase